MKLAALNSKVIVFVFVFFALNKSPLKFVKVILSDFSSGFSPVFHSLFLISIQSSRKNPTNTMAKVNLTFPLQAAIDLKTPLTMISISLPNFLKSCNI